MPRKTKDAELQDWLKGYKPFLVEIDFIAYKAAICVLAADYPDCQAKVAKWYPGMIAIITSQLTSIVV